MWGMTLNDVPLISLTLLWLVFLEGLLSADNALVLAMLVRHLPKPLQKRALRYGIWGAFAFRVVAVLMAKILLQFWWLKIVGGAYLVYLAATHFLAPKDEPGKPRAARFGDGFWATVIYVELTDIAFSIDSILAAVGMAEGLPDHLSDSLKLGVVVLGGILGIITMRFVAGYFILLLEKFHGLETGAYSLVAWIGLKLVANGLYQGKLTPFEINDWIFWIGMLLIVLLSFFSRTPAHPPKSPPEPDENPFTSPRTPRSTPTPASPPTAPASSSPPENSPPDKRPPASPPS